MNDCGYLQHAVRPGGPFRTEAVTIKHEYADRWLAHFEGRWRRVHVQVKRLFIIYRGERIAIQIEGL